ncbi:MAG: 3-phosphoshikimate 1-carboxyvinyltransferase [Clostridia bacterium]|nr:3-phosphoshikimate 1-carboxyvinyltransferase [Clostridia bacterium]
MKLSISPSSVGGSVCAIASKSVAHRLLICAAFADNTTLIRCDELSEDISATVRCLSSLGAKIVRDAPFYRVTPILELQKNAHLDCGESGSTLRFLVPLTCMLGADASFVMAGRLPERPLSPLREELERGGIVFSDIGSNPLMCRGSLNTRDFTISGSVSSQFISGLLFALAISGKGGSIRIDGRLESVSYLSLTVDALRQFGAKIEQTDTLFSVAPNSGLSSPREVSVEGDWSNAAFPLCMGAIGKHPITVTGLLGTSHQGDRAIVDLLLRFGAKVTLCADECTVSPAPLHGIEIDASQIPDLVPVLAVVAALAEGKTIIKNASRLRIKESDRLKTTTALLTSLGATITETEDGLSIEGVSRLVGGSVSSFCDHRIAMSAAVASLACASSVVLDGAESVAKSYPDFWRDMKSLGMNICEL